MINPRNLEGSPDKYFVVPPGKEFDYDAHGILMEQLEILNNTISNMTSSSEPVDKEYYVSVLSNIMGSLLYQAKEIVEAGEK